MSKRETSTFLKAVLGSAPDDLWTMLWTLQDKQSHWHPIGQGHSPLADLAGRLAEEGSDVYLAVSCSTEARGPHRRISADQSAGIAGLWADIDFTESDAHKKWNLPPTQEAAMEVLDACGVKPTLLVHSGHGLQAWWLFDEFWTFDGESDRLAAARLSGAWNTTLRVRAAERGWTVDSVFDLSRVMRVPGTKNLKGEPVPVRLLDASGPRYGRDDFDPFCVDEGQLPEGLSPVRQYVVDGGLALDASADPPFTRFEALRANDPQFAASWDRTRKDLSDQSPSSYDMSLASLSVRAGWADQEVANLLIASRRRHGDDLKLRLDYYRRTIGKAHENLSRVEAMEAMDDVADDLVRARLSGDDEEVKVKRRAVHETLSNQLGVEVLGGIKFRSTPPSFRLVTPTGFIELGGANEVLSWATFRANVAAETRKLVPRYKANEWDRIVELFFHSCEEQDTGMESTEHGEVFVWLSEYLLSHPPVDALDEAGLTEHPFSRDGQTFVFGGAFRTWLWLQRQEKLTQKELGRRLRLFGCTPYRLNVSIDGRKTTRSVWILPDLDGDEA